MSGSSEKDEQFLLAGLLQRPLGIIKDTDFERFSARVNTEYKPIKDILTIGEHLTVNRTDEVAAPGGILSNTLQFNPSLPVYTTDGSFASPVAGYPDRANPVAVLHRNKDNRYKYWRLFGDAYVNRRSSRASTSALPSVSIAVRRGSASSPLRHRGATWPTPPMPSRPSRSTGRWMWNLVASYNIDFGRNHLDALAGIELNRETSTWFSGLQDRLLGAQPRLHVAERRRRHGPGLRLGRRLLACIVLRQGELLLRLALSYGCDASPRRQLALRRQQPLRHLPGSVAGLAYEQQAFLRDNTWPPTTSSFASRGADRQSGKSATSLATLCMCPTTA